MKIYFFVIFFCKKNITLNSYLLLDYLTTKTLYCVYAILYYIIFYCNFLILTIVILLRSNFFKDKEKVSVKRIHRIKIIFII